MYPLTTTSLTCSSPLLQLPVQLYWFHITALKEPGRLLVVVIPIALFNLWCLLTGNIPNNQEKCMFTTHLSVPALHSGVSGTTTCPEDGINRKDKVQRDLRGGEQLPYMRDYLVTQVKVMGNLYFPNKRCTVKVNGINFEGWR